MQRKLLPFFLLSLLLPLNLLLAQRTSAALWGISTNEDCRLYWETYSWPNDLVGFVVKKKTAKDTTWRQLNTETICPQIAPRNWNNMGLNASEAITFQKTYESYLSEGKLSFRTREQLLKDLIRYNGLLVGDRINMKNDYNIALILGFAYIDHNYKKSQQTSYGLFYANADGKTASKPITVFEPEGNAKLKLDKKFEVSQNQLRLIWSIPEKEYAQAGIYGFNISRKESSSKDEIKLFEAPLDYDKAINGNIHWSLLDPTAKPSLDYTYTLTPVTIFQTQLKPIKIKYKASQYKPVKVPAIDSVTLVNDAEFLLRWKPDSLAPYQKRIKELYMERSDENPAIFTKIATDISLKRSSYIDSSQLKYQQNYSYRLCVIDKKGIKWAGKAQGMPFLGMRQPSKPDSLKVTFKMILQKPYVFLTWTKSPNATGYILSSDEKGNGKLLENISMPLIQNNELLYEVSGDGGLYQFAITPVNELGMRGASSTVSCTIPTLKLPPFPEFKAVLTKNDLVEFSWDYPKDIQLKSFNIIAGGNNLLNLPPTSDRKYTLPLYESNQASKVVVYQIEAVGWAMSKKSPIAPLYIPTYKVGQPTLLQATLVKEKGKYYAQLSWLEASNPAEEIVSSIIFVDEAAPGTFIEIKNEKLIKGGRYTYMLPDPDRDTYKFQIASVTASGHIGPVATVTLPLKDLKK